MASKQLTDHDLIDNNITIQSSSQQNWLPSQELHEIIDDVPSWFLRRGVTVIGLVMLVIITVSAFVKYPEQVSIPIKMSQTSSPKKIMSKQGGRLVKLLVSSGQQVTASQNLAYMESVGNHEHILTIRKTLLAINDHLSGKREKLPILEDAYQLGELQNGFKAFYQEYLKFNDTYASGYFLEKNSLIQQEISKIHSLKKQIIKQQEIRKMEFENQAATYEAYQKLYQKQVISKSEFLQQQNIYLNARQPLLQTESELIYNQNQITSKEKEKFEMKHTILEIRSAFAQALQSYLSEVDIWMQDHIISSPIAGKVSLAGIIEENQHFKAQEELFVVDPGKSAIFGVASITEQDIAKVHVGQQALIKLKSYPYQKHGTITGQLSFLSDQAYKDSLFSAKITFTQPPNLQLKGKKTIINGMTGSAEIIIDEKSILTKLFENFSRIFD